MVKMAEKTAKQWRNWSGDEFHKLFRNYRVRPFLWRKSDEDYLNRDKKRAAIAEIARELNCSSDMVKEAWKAMRDNYRKEIKLMNPAKSGSSGRQKKKKWRFYEALKFLSAETTTADYISDNLFTVLCSIGFFGKSDATIDLTGVDLSKFQYFKDNVEAKMMAKAQQALQLLAPLTDKIEKAKAVVTYFKNVALGNSDHKQEQIIEFDPHFGEAWQPHYARHFGPRGAHLIEVLGHGHSPRELHEYGALHRKSIEY